MQLPSGEVINGDVPAGLSDDEVKSYVQMKRPDLFGAPAGGLGGIKSPTPQMQKSNVAIGMTGGTSGEGIRNPQQPAERFALENPEQQPALAGAAVTGASAAGAPFLAPRLAGAALTATSKLAPYAGPAIASYAINKARELPVVGPVIDKIPYAEMLPWLYGGKSEAEAKPRRGRAEPIEPTPTTDQVPGRPYMPNPRYQPTPAPEPLPPRSGPLLLKGTVAPFKDVGAPNPEIPESIRQGVGLRTGGQPVTDPAAGLGTLPFLPRPEPVIQPSAPRVKPQQIQDSIERGLGNEPRPIKPGVAMKNQLPRESSAVESYNYDPAKREFHVKPKGGDTGYIYGDVSPEDAGAFHASESKGQAWQQMMNNVLVGKVVNGKRIAVKPVSKPNQGNDLTDILTRSVRQAKGMAAD